MQAWAPWAGCGWWLGEGLDSWQVVALGCALELGPGEVGPGGGSGCRAQGRLLPCSVWDIRLVGGGGGRYWPGASGVAGALGPAESPAPWGQTTAWFQCK